MSPVWLVAHDMQTHSEDAALLAAEELGRLGGGELVVAHVAKGTLPPLPIPPFALTPDPARVVDTEAEREDVASLEALTRRIEHRFPTVRASVRALHGDVATELLAAADDIGADRIILAAEQRSVVSRLLLGSVSDQVVHQSSIPVLVVKRGPAPTMVEATEEELEGSPA